MAIQLEIADRLGESEPYTVSFAEPPLALGRAPANDVPLPDQEVSSAHAQIVYGTGASRPDTTPGLALVDLGSVNGTVVRGATIAPRVPVPLADGDVVTIGRFDITVGITTGAASSVTRNAEVTARKLARSQLGGETGAPTRYLQVESGGADQGRRLKLEQADHPQMLGRAPGAQLKLDDPGAPPKAASLFVEELAVRVERLEDGPPVRVNDAEITACVLRDGDTLSVESLSLRFVDRYEELLLRLARPHPADSLAPMGEPEVESETPARGTSAARALRVEGILEAVAATLGGAAVAAALVLIAWAVGL